MLIDLPTGYLEIPDKVNVTEHIVSRHVILGRGSDTALADDRGTVVTFAELDAWTNRVGRALCRVGVGKGESFLIRASNSLDYAAALLGGMKVGAIPIPSSTDFSVPELKTIITSAQPRVALTTPELAEPIRLLESQCPSLRRIFSLEGETPELRSFHEIVEPQSGSPIVEETAADDGAFLLFAPSSKGGLTPTAHAHRVVIAAGDPVRYGLLRLRPGDRCLVPIEFSSFLAIDFALLFPLAAGAQSVVYRGDFEPERLLEVIERHRITVLIGRTSLYEMLRNLPGRGYDLSSVRMALCAGRALPDDTCRDVKRRFGLEVRQITGHVAAHVYVADSPDTPPEAGSLGFPLPGRKVMVMTETGNPAEVGEVGSLCIRCDDPALALGHDAGQWLPGWYNTGDLVYSDDDGRLWPAHLTDRQAASASSEDPGDAP